MMCVEGWVDRKENINLLDDKGICDQCQEFVSEQTTQAHVDGTPVLRIGITASWFQLN